jgi:hypothetical protein
MTTRFKDDGEIRALVRTFEDCSLYPETFKHYQHLAVALWYLAHHPYDEAAEKMRSGIRKLAAAYGKMGYHETITEFWLRMVSNFIAGRSVNESVTALTNRLLEQVEDKALIYEYYSADLLSSAVAKERWVEPDLKPLPLRATSSTRTPASQLASVA